MGRKVELRAKDIKPNVISAAFSTSDLQNSQTSLSQLKIAKASDFKETLSEALFLMIWGLDFNDSH